MPCGLYQGMTEEVHNGHFNRKDNRAYPFGDDYSYICFEGKPFLYGSVWLAHRNFQGSATSDYKKSPLRAIWYAPFIILNSFPHAFYYLDCGNCMGLS